ncbi:hypothetical protein V866_005227 [Kwoniella sp. B9012]|uniref:Uncharacterized protein n=1 Tax=Kwoniella europaea PYCC6329 TaxID=1423913 RepID=A0AAX4KMF8_9TREE
MTLLSTILGFSAFGFGARCFQLGLQKRPIFDAPSGHLISTAAFGVLGYGAFYADKKQTALLAERKKILLERREKENLEWQATKGQGHAV